MENTYHTHGEEHSPNCEEYDKKCRRWKGRGCAGGAGCIYGLAFIGAAVYYIQQATTFGQGVLGILKALVWPAMVIYKLLEFLGM